MAEMMLTLHAREWEQS